MRRHLVYNCWASTRSDAWRLNVERLCRYREAFNGRKLILIKDGPDTCDLSEVKAAFEPLGDVEFSVWPNDPALGEVVGFIEALELLVSVDPEEATFYAHTKGAKYHRDAPTQYMTAVRRWRNRMYHECLSDVGRVEEVLQTSACCGCFLQEGNQPPVPSTSRWHFAGTFWWVKNSKLFGLPNWRDVDKHTHGVEGYLGKMFPVEEAHNFFKAPARSRGMYSAECVYRCSLCSHEFVVWPKMRDEPTRVCKKCFKRAAEFLEVTPEPADDL